MSANGGGGNGNCAQVLMILLRRRYQSVLAPPRTTMARARSEQTRTRCTGIRISACCYLRLSAAGNNPLCDNKPCRIGRRDCIVHCRRRYCRYNHIHILRATLNTLQAARKHVYLRGLGFKFIVAAAAAAPRCWQSRRQQQSATGAPCHSRIPASCAALISLPARAGCDKMTT